MKQYFVVADVHSFYDELIKALNDAGFDRNNPNHIVINCGDLLDRGSKPNECLKFMNDLHREGRAILIKGNHESLLESILKRGYFETHDDHNGTLDTCLYISKMDDIFDDYPAVIEKTKHDAELKYYLNNLINYYELKSYIFVHGWIPIAYDKKGHPLYDKNWRKSEDWYDAIWINGMECWKNGVREPDKTIVCGHWNTSWGHSRIHHCSFESLRDAIVDMTVDELKSLKYNNLSSTRKLYKKYVMYTPFIDDGIIAIDATTVLSEKVNCIVITEDN